MQIEVNHKEHIPMCLEGVPVLSVNLSAVPGEKATQRLLFYESHPYLVLS